VEDSQQRKSCILVDRTAAVGVMAKRMVIHVGGESCSDGATLSIEGIWKQQTGHELCISSQVTMQ